MLELIRGAFVLHTRGYNAKKPLNPKSNFAQLYDRAKIGAEKKINAAVPLIPTTARTPDEQESYQKIYGRLKPALVEPPFQPAPPWKLFQLQSKTDAALCLFAERSPGSYGKLSTAEIKSSCANDEVLASEPTPLSKAHERQTWMWYNGSGHIRPAIREPGRVYCLDSEPYGLRGSAKDYTGPPMVNVCSPVRDGQIWQLLQPTPARDGSVDVDGSGFVLLFNAHTNKCLSLESDVETNVEAADVRSKAADVRSKQLNFGLSQASCDHLNAFQLWKTKRFAIATHGMKRTYIETN